MTITQHAAWAHSAGAPLDAKSNNASASDFAFITCYNDSNDSSGEPDSLYVQIEDQSPPVDGLLVSAQIFKDKGMTNITDTVSGDHKPSAFTFLKGGGGVYFIAVNKTNVGVRNFVISYHCQTATGGHTGTDVEVLQIQ